MEPGSKVEMPPKGADLSFLQSGTSDNDTPSRWLTFGGTPNGNTTPGTAFGSPFWASLSHSAKHSPKTYSPSKELNPFELSFFPKSDTLAGGDSGSHAADSSDQIKREGMDGDQTQVDSLKASLKRPFQDASTGDSAGAAAEGQATTSTNSSDTLIPPSWKRPKFATAMTSQASTSSADHPSPALGSGPSPDSGSPASSVIPTPSILPAILPSSKGPSRKGSDTADPLFQQASPGFSALSSHTESVAINTHLASEPRPSTTGSAPATFQQGVQGPPAPLFYNPSANPNQHYQHYPPGFPHHQPQQQILPPKHIQPGPRHASPAATSLQSPTHSEPQSATSQHGPHHIPYANGRAPSTQPSGTSTRSRRAKTKAVAAVADQQAEDEWAGKQEQEEEKQKSTTSGRAAVAQAKKATVPAPQRTQEKRADSEKPADAEGKEDLDEDESKRRAFLERNRQAACRSRQKKKEWIGNLENHAAQLQAQNSALNSEIESLRKELFALRHTLSFHERCGYGSGNVNEWSGRESVPGPHGTIPSGLVQATPHHSANIAALTQQPGDMPGHPHSASLPHGAGPPHPPSAIHSTIHPHHNFPDRHQAAIPAQLRQHDGQTGPAIVRMPVGAQTMPVAPGLTGNIAPAPSVTAPQVASAATLAPPIFAPKAVRMPYLNITPNALSQSGQTPSQDHARPGSAGPTFGISTPNFAELFGGAIGSFGGFKSPGGLLMSPQIPNTFGLSLQDIPVRPASAPPTPSPALDFKPSGLPVDYFSSKNNAYVALPPSGSFGDLMLPSGRSGMSQAPAVVA